jgi:hypothetical protein
MLQKLKFTKKILPPQRTAIGPYIPLWPAVLPGGPRCSLAVGSYRRGPRRQGPNAVARGSKTYGPTAGGSYRRGL